MRSSVQPTLNVSGPLAQFGRPNLRAAYKPPYLVLFNWIFHSRNPAQCLHYINSLREELTHKKNNNKNQDMKLTFSAQAVQVWENDLILIHTFPSHQQNRGDILSQFLAVPGLECPEVNKNKLWHRIKGRDIILLGKQRLIAIMICGSAAGADTLSHTTRWSFSRSPEPV